MPENITTKRFSVNLSEDLVAALDTLPGGRTAHVDAAIADYVFRRGVAMKSAAMIRKAARAAEQEEGNA